jgi:hypothetical protein
MSIDIDLAPVKVGDEVEVCSLSAFRRGTVVAVHDDGTVDLEHQEPGREGKDEHGRRYIQLGGAGPGEFVTMLCRARPEMLADGTRRFLAMDPAEYRTNVDVEKALFDDFMLQLAKVQVANEPENIERRSIEIAELSRRFKIYKRHLNEKPMPSTGQLACGTVVVERGKETEWIRLYGKVTSSDKLGNVCVEFDHFEFHDMSDEDFEPEARGYLGREIKTHAVDMEWQDDVGEWTFDF